LKFIEIAETEGEESTEVISLSNWMHESTMLNVISNIPFFKNYCVGKLETLKSKEKSENLQHLEGEYEL